MSEFSYKIYWGLFFFLSLSSSFVTVIFGQRNAILANATVAFSSPIYSFANLFSQILILIAFSLTIIKEKLTLKSIINLIRTPLVFFALGCLFLNLSQFHISRIPILLFMISIVCQVFSQKNLAQIPFLKLLASFLLINLASTIFLKPLSYFNSGTRDLFSFEISGQRASGFFLHPNALGIFAAAATVYGLSLKRVSVNWRWIIIISGSYLTYLSGSRTALLALILTIFFKLFLSTKLKKPFLFITLVLSGATMFGILDSLVDPGRRLIWSRIRFYFLDNISLLGQGPSVWSSLSEKGILITSSTFNAHNQWLEIYAIYGILGVILLFATMFRLILKAENSQLPMLLFFLIAFCTEVPFSLNVIDARLLLVPMFLMLPKTYPLSLLKRGKEE